MGANPVGLNMSTVKDPSMNGSVVGCVIDWLV